MANRTIQECSVGTSLGGAGLAGAAQLRESGSGPRPPLAPVLDSVTGEEVARTPAEAIDLVAALDYGAGSAGLPCAR